MSVSDTIENQAASQVISTTTCKSTNKATNKAANKKTDYRWQCRRGMLELDILLNNFVDSLKVETTDNVDESAVTNTSVIILTAKQEQTFELLLTYPDQTLLELLLGSAMSSNPEISSIIKLIQSTSSN